jgi:hypothetical protein
MDAAVEIVPGELEGLKISPFADLRVWKLPNKLIAAEISVRNTP